MHIQKSNWIAWAITIFILTSAIFSNKIDVQASSYQNKTMDLSKLYDIALTKTGIVANKSTIDNVVNQTINTIEGTTQSYKQWCEENGKVRNATTWQEYLESDAYSSLPFRLSAWALRSADIINYIITGESLTDELRNLIPQAMTGSPIVDMAKGFTLPSDVVEDIREEFENYIYDYGDYFYLRTFKPEELNPVWFQTTDKWQKSVNYLKTIPGYCYIEITSLGSYGNFTFDSTSNMKADEFKYWVYANTDLFVSTSCSDSYEYYINKVYNEDWKNPPNCWYVTTTSGFMDYLTYDEMVNRPARYGDTYSNTPKLKKSGKNTNPTVPIGIYSNDGRLLKVYRSENAMKASVVGRDSYYVTDNSMDYITNNDNSVKVTEEYIVNNSGTYSHDIIQETINNTENITQDTVNNIVNTSSTTIINNYGSTGNGSGEGGNDDDENGNGILDGLGSLIDGLGSILGFLLKAIGEIFGLVGNLFNTLMEGIKALGSIFTGFTGLLGSLFPFIPVELITFVTLAIEATIAIAVWKYFKK